ncbi:MAG TPA: hypothetical protein VHV74_02965 [Pseudonocardiaceae bacterium]|nr:hypothetical protein [Pseudonocardiaceae bacterium]
MAVVLGRKTARWALVAAAAAVLCAIPSVVASLPVGSAHLTPQQLQRRIADSGTQPYGGYAQTQSELGLPNLPALGNVTSLLSGISNVRVWYRAANENRVDVIDTIGERDLYQSPDGDFTWDYGTQVLTEIVGEQSVRLPQASDLLPPDLARRVLAMDPVDRPVSLPPRRIAGIDADGIRLRPTDPATTVGQVDIWADPANGLPLRVELTARGAQKPIIVSKFMNLTLGAPDPADVRPPDTGNLAQARPPDIASIIAQFNRFPLPDELAGYQRQPQLAGLPGIARYGAGVATFVLLPLPRNIGSSAFDTVSKNGGKMVPVVFGQAELIQIPLLTVMLYQVGFGRRHLTFLLAGFVNPTVLQQATTDLSQQPFRFRRPR